MRSLPFGGSSLVQETHLPVIWGEKREA